MTDTNNRDDDFEFDDFFPEEDLGDDVDLGDDDDGPPIGGGYDDNDMPTMDEEPERSNRTFVILAIALILLFVIGLVVILLIISTPRGPNEAEFTATAVVATNQAVAVQLELTATQDVLNLQATQTALQWTPTPTDTPQPTETPTETATATATMTNTPDLTGTAVFQALDSVAMTQTALAASPTPTATQPPQVDLQALLATEVAQATTIGGYQQSAYATSAAIATLSSLGAIDQASIDAVGAEQAAALAGIQAQSTVVADAGVQLDGALAQSAALNATLAFNLALATSNAPGLQGVLSTPAAQASLDALTVQATLTSLPPGDPGLAAATSTAFSAQAVLATPAGGATQSALSTRSAFVQEALGTVTVPTLVLPTVDQSIPPAALTATAIVDAYLTATALAQATPTVEVTAAPAGETPFIAPPPTALPETGLFDDTTSSGGLGVLSIALLGLVGVIVSSRVLRSRKQ